MEFSLFKHAVAVTLIIGGSLPVGGRTGYLFRSTPGSILLGLVLLITVLLIVIMWESMHDLGELIRNMF